MSVSAVVAKVGVASASMFEGARLQASRTPFDRWETVRPYTQSRQWYQVHYGVFLPDLPTPLRYLNIMTLIGAYGAEVFDQDHLAAADARRTTTVLSSTAHEDHHYYRAFDAGTDCEFAEDGSLLRWGGDLSITVDKPLVAVRGRYPTFEIDLELEVTDVASYFVKAPFYEHFSLVAPYSGVVAGLEVSGTGTFEYARLRCMPQALTSRPLPTAFKLPMDFFTYQIIDVDPSTQLLLTDVSARGNIACRLLHVRRQGRPAEVYEDVRFGVLESGFEVDDRGRRMPVPRRFTWTVYADGAEVLAIEGAVDSPWRYGHGPGYAAAYSYSGHFESKIVDGSAYIEWIDVRQ